ncbi:hypothetical protein [Hafnia paralvei]|uniref:hypothetical protein n=1 Tax=Hafnia paralvei TaxID=546367 RepID=UPI001419E408|nr:hypothetical protein [Hafnia paralvei]NIH31941.1 hypothetical protein [Hafnia paralvei]
MTKKHAYVVQRPRSSGKGTEKIHYVVIVEKKEILQATTQEEAADWALEEGYAVHVARVRNLEDVDNPNHWREYP